VTEALPYGAVMTEGTFQLLRAGSFAAAFGIAVALQRFRPHSSRRGSVRVNVGLWAVHGLATTAVCGACVCTVARWAAGAGVGLLNGAVVPLWLSIPTTVVALDLVSYVWHRANHVVPVFWRFHRVHHSDPSFTVSTALRFHPGELVLSIPLRLLAVVLLGAPVVGVVVFEALFAVSNLVEHGDIDLPLVLERVVGDAFVTPAIHRFHHTRAGLDRDHNFGTILVLWDRALGTYRPSTSATRVDVGLTEVRESLGLGAALLLPLRRLGPVG
jgi:sterol desaturase/sphingolipid hydroxylase (fatty acid hydroxylase superfamily)